MKISDRGAQFQGTLWRPNRMRRWPVACRRKANLVRTSPGLLPLALVDIVTSTQQSHRAQPSLSQRLRSQRLSPIMFPTLIRRMADSAARKHVTKELPNHVVGNPYQARKVWPPDFAALNPQQQLRFEKKYKRRMRHAAYSPRWDKGIKYAQLVTITGWLRLFARGLLKLGKCSPAHSGPHLDLLLRRIRMVGSQIQALR